MVDHVAQRTERLKRLMETLGVNCLALAREHHGEAFAQASQNCIRCPHPGACLAWIEAQAQGTAAAPPHFCPNCELLRSYVTQP
jgi:hypothetical protein